jgi:hypothetical protein
MVQGQIIAGADPSWVGAIICTNIQHIIIIPKCRKGAIVLYVLISRIRRDCNEHLLQPNKTLILGITLYPWLRQIILTAYILFHIF